MPHHVFTRQALYTLVWAEPMRSVANRLGVSDVGLAKACRRADIPVPERGYWAKLQHGKPVSRQPLPRRENIPDRVVIAPATPRPAPPPTAGAVLEGAEPPAVIVPDTLQRPHPIVSGWLKADGERAREWRSRGWGQGATIDRTDPLESRRLRIYTALLTTLEKARFELEPGLNLDEGVTARRDGEAIAFRIYFRQRKAKRPLTADERHGSWNAGKSEINTLVPAGDLVLKVKTYTRGAMAEDYRETKRSLETQLGEIIVAFEAGVAELKAWRAERAAEEEHRHQAMRLRERREAHQRDLARRRERLLEASARWRAAADLRAMIAAAEGSSASAAPQFEAWRAWALAEADALDPLTKDLDLSTPEPFEA